MPVSKRLRYEILRRDGNTCRYCGRTAPDVPLRIDHVTPVALGGSDDPVNLVTACEDCNSGKSSTNPDAPLIADVASDALRWAQARQVAAQQMLADLSRRQEMRQRFKAEWDRWTFGGRTVDLPDGWERSVENFLAAGLPLEVLLDCVPRAMGTSRVKLDGMFRYMCGIAWTRVRELDTVTHASLDSPAQPARVVDGDQYKAAVESLYGHISHFEDDALRAMWSESFDHIHAEDEDEHGQPVDFSRWHPDVKALVAAVGDKIERADGYVFTVQHALSLIPGDEREQLRATSRHSHEMAGEPYTAEDIDRYALLLLVRKHYPKTTESVEVGF